MINFSAPRSSKNKSQFGVTLVFALHLPVRWMGGSLPFRGSGELQIRHLYISASGHSNLPNSELCLNICMYMKEKSFA